MRATLLNNNQTVKPLSKQTILVVDDEQDLLDLIEYNLKKEGYHVLRAENGQDGIRIARETKPDRKSTRLNSSHVAISYAVFCLKKKRNKKYRYIYKRQL